MRVRAEEAPDYDAVRSVNTLAFGSPAEAELVDALRGEPSVISLVADAGAQILGHILFSPVTLVGHAELTIFGLGPMAVLPERQREGIGTVLVEEGLARCRRAKVGAVIVLGHPKFYPRFGFAPSTRFGIDSEYEVPEDVFMVLETAPGYLNDRSGRIRYHPAFRNV